mmetsp:Transcript_88590/g.156356  ORF Transcript_88590/g.156356 Transcript_88590/m.156356 type:complete len:228 (-) Transcript_88590:139-822(-)
MASSSNFCRRVSSSSSRAILSRILAIDMPAFATKDAGFPAAFSRKSFCASRQKVSASGRCPCLSSMRPRPRRTPARLPDFFPSFCSSSKQRSALWKYFDASGKLPMELYVWPMFSHKAALEPTRSSISWKSSAATLNLPCFHLVKASACTPLICNCPPRFRHTGTTSSRTSAHLLRRYSWIHMSKSLKNVASVASSSKPRSRRSSSNSFSNRSSSMSWSSTSSSGSS